MLKKQKDLEEKEKLEEFLASTSLLWTNEILPNWSTMLVNGLRLGHIYMCNQILL